MTSNGKPFCTKLTPYHAIGSFSVTGLGIFRPYSFALHSHCIWVLVDFHSSWQPKRAVLHGSEPNKGSLQKLRNAWWRHAWASYTHSFFSNGHTTSNPCRFSNFMQSEGPISAMLDSLLHSVACNFLGLKSPAGVCRSQWFDKYHQRSAQLCTNYPVTELGVYVYYSENMEYVYVTFNNSGLCGAPSLFACMVGCLVWMQKTRNEPKAAW